MFHLKFLVVSSILLEMSEYISSITIKKLILFASGFMVRFAVKSNQLEAFSHNPQ